MICRRSSAADVPGSYCIETGHLVQAGMSVPGTKLVLHGLTERITETSLRSVAIAWRYWPVCRGRSLSTRWQRCHAGKIGNRRRAT